jgi:L-asparaginase II
MGLSNDDLECGAHEPRDEDAARDVIRRGKTIDRVFNNCSGKHSGFLTTALHLGEPTAGYTDAARPVQRRPADVLSALGGADLTTTARGIDGCGIPVLGMPLSALARFAGPRSLLEQRSRAAERIYASMILHPACVRGTRGFDAVVMRAGRGRFAAKTGTEGVHIGIVPERQIGIAVKVEDGARRASGVALCALLDHLALLSMSQVREGLAPFMDVSLTNLIGDPVSRVRPAPG